MPQMKHIISIKNGVTSADVFQKMNLNQITRIFSDVKYYLEQFPELVFRLKNAKTATLIFTLDKLVCTGAKKESDAYRSVHNLHALLEEKELMLYD
jgi:TATA binding protein of transcription factor TFIID